MATIVGVVSSSKKSSGKIINGYVAGDSDTFCAGRTSATTVYNSTYTSIANAFTNSSSIYSNSGLSTLAATGYYGDTSGGTGDINYYWSGTVWDKSNTCS
jgi:hypothetical protein